MRSVLRGAVIAGLLLAVAGCAGEDPGSGGGQGNNGGGTAATGAVAGTTGGTAGTGSFGNGNGNVSGISGGTAGTTASLPDGGCPLGQVCLPTNPDSNTCGEFALEGDVKITMTPGNILVIFDRSGSMANDWNGQARWLAAGGAMMTALTGFQDSLTIGAVFFPSDQNILSCVVEPITAATQLPFQPGPAALTKMQTGGAGGTAMYQPGLGQTPTLQGLQSADAAIIAATDPAGPSPLVGTTAVILVTDGDPNCTWNQQGAVDIVTAWAAKGIKTYVLGVPGVGGTGVATLNTVAAAGGTMQYIAPTDPMALQQKIQDIVQSTVKVGFDSCTINFDPPPEAPEKVDLVVTENGVKSAMPKDFNGTVVWTITPDGKTVELLGDLCEAAKKGVYDRIDFTFGCQDLPPADPPIVPD